MRGFITSTRSPLLLLVASALILSCGFFKKKKSHSFRGAGMDATVSEEVLTEEHNGPKEGGTANSEETETEAMENELSAALVDAGIRDFSQMFNNMIAVTGVDPESNLIGNNNTTIRQYFEQNILSSLPGAGNDIKSFSGAHQAALVKIGVEICHSMLSDQTLREEAIPGFPFDQNNASNAFSEANQALIASSLADRFWGMGIDNRPDDAMVVAEIKTLVQGILAENNDQINTLDIATGVCTSILTALPANIL